MSIFTYNKNKEPFVSVDEWLPKPEDEIVQHVKGAVIIPVSKVFNCTNNSFDHFIISSKRAYDKEKFRNHWGHYINYFLKYYDKDKELIMIYAKIKYLIDLYGCSYNKEAFIYDLIKYVMSTNIIYKVSLMNRANYKINLSKKKNENDPRTQYTNKHGHILMKISLLMNICIPLLTHYIYTNKIANTDEFLLYVYDRILYLDYFDADIYDKIYSTCDSKIEKSKNHMKLWDKQEIRGINDTIQKMYSAENILLNIMPKFLYSEHIIAFIDSSISYSMGYKIENIPYEMDYCQLSSSKRDLDQNSDMDKFENTLTKENEAIYLQNKVNCEKTMEQLTMLYPISQDEIDYYINNLSENQNDFIINGFQKQLIFNIFYKYFGDTSSIRAINRDDYIKLMIIAKRKLIENKMVLLPYIVAGKVNRINKRNKISKKILTKLENSQFFNIIKDKYRSEKLINNIYSILGNILASDFSIIDYNNKELTGRHIEVLEDVICEEVIMYCMEI